MKLKNKVAIITGSSRGIGKAIATAMAKEGAKVVITSRHLPEADKTAKEIQKLGGQAMAIKCDVSKKNEIEKMVSETVKKFGQLDILVNNAGIVSFDSFLELKEEDWDKVLAIDLKGTFLCSQVAVKQMVKQEKGGKIINIASVAGFVGFPRLAHYCSAKGGIIELTKEMAVELAKYKININAIGPGVIETAMTKGLLQDPKSKQDLLSRIPLNRIGQPKDIAPLAVFLASEDADYITGQTIFVDGGWTSI